MENQNDILEEIVNDSSNSSIDEEITRNRRLTINQERFYEKKHWFFKYRIKVLKKLNKKFLVGNNLKILDIGIGTGTISKDLEKYGEVVHIEMNKESILANEDLSNILEGNFPWKVKLPNEKYDYIILYNLIEYLDNLKWVFEVLKSKLKENGKILISTLVGNELTDNDKLYRIKQKFSLSKIEEICDTLNLKINYYTFFERHSLEHKLKDSIDELFEENSIYWNIIPTNNDLIYKDLVNREFSKIGRFRIKNWNQLFLSIRFLSEKEIIKKNNERLKAQKKNNFIDKTIDKIVKNRELKEKEKEQNDDDF